MARRFDTPAMKRTSDWILSQEFPILPQEFPSDITITVGDATFNLHMLPLASRCGYIRKHVVGINGCQVTHIDITGLPGGSMAFELVAKFCYGEDFEFTEHNVAMLRCAAEHLEMTDDESMGESLVGRTEAYLEDVALTSLAGAVTVLRRSEELLPVAEEVDLVGRSIDAIAYHIVCSDGHFSVSQGNTTAGGYYGVGVAKAVDDWWADELTSLRIDTFQRVLIAMKARGFKGIALGTLIMLYAQKSLRRLDMNGGDKKKMDPRQEHEKRVVLETIVSLLPKEKNSAHPYLSEPERKKRENEELKMELLRLKLHQRDQSSPSLSSPTSGSGALPPSGRSPLPKKASGGGGGGGFMNNVSKKLGRLNPFQRVDAVGGAGKVRTKPAKDRRNSIGDLPHKDRRHSIGW
nr:unnamed protein product [Digitaria exilis]